MKIGKEYLTFPDQRIFRWLGLLDMHDHAGSAIDLFRTRHNFSTGFPVSSIVESAAHASFGFHQNIMSIFKHDLNTGRGHANSVLCSLDFFKYTDNHDRSFDDNGLK